MRMDERTAPGALVLADAAAIRILWPDLTELARNLTSPRDWVERCGADVAAATLATTALWLVALWLGVGLTAATLGRLPGALGRACRRLAWVALPAIAHRATISAAVGPASLGAVFAPASAICRHAPPGNRTSIGQDPQLHVSGRLPHATAGGQR